MREKININRQDIFFITILILTAIVSFFLGKISEQYKITLQKKNEIHLIKKNIQSEIKVVASKKGKKYHLPWCSGALHMSEKNKIFFKNKTEAEKAGYEPAKNCEGL